MPYPYIYSKPDAVYLLALEEINFLFQKSLLYNYIMQLFPLLFTFLILVPLALQSLQLTIPFLCTIFIVLMVTKAWNIYIHWMWRDRHKNIWLIVRITCNALLIYMLFYAANVLILGGLLLLLAFLLLYTKTAYKTNTVGLHNRTRRKMNVRFINLLASLLMFLN